MFYCSPNEELEELKLNWKAKSIQYLCIRITKKDIEKWSTYPLSLTDRMNAVKMTTPPCKKRQGGGGLALPNFREDFNAAQSRPLIY